MKEMAWYWWVTIYVVAAIIVAAVTNVIDEKTDTDWFSDMSGIPGLLWAVAIFWPLWIAGMSGYGLYLGTVFVVKRGFEVTYAAVTRKKNLKENRAGRY